MENRPLFRTDTLSLPEGREFSIRRNAQPVPEAAELHYHDHYELLFCLTGQLTYQVEGRSYQLEPGSVLLIHPYQLHHALKSTGSTERIALRFEECIVHSRTTPEWPLETMMLHQTQEHGNYLQLTPSLQKQVGSILSAFLQECVCAPFGHEIMEQTLLTQLMLCLYRATSEKAAPQPPVTADETLVQQVIAYFEGHLSEHISLEALAQQFYTDRSSLSRAFTRLVGCPPHSYLTQKRLQKASLLLQAGVPPQEAALQVGFPDYSNFYRRFRSAFGSSPREWQTAHS